MAIIVGDEERNFLFGSDGQDELRGLGGDDFLDGGNNRDVLSGGDGDDVFVVSFTTWYSLHVPSVIPGIGYDDEVIENDGGGNDTVFMKAVPPASGTFDGGNTFYYTYAKYELPTNVENGIIEGVDFGLGADYDSFLTGNALDNLLIGNRGENTLSGRDGDDQIDGSAGADTMYGGLGNDTYWVDNASDLVVEDLNAGTDEVFSAVSYELPENVENLWLTGVGNNNGTGNALVNAISGNAGNNSLDGKAGADILSGGAGNDRYFVDNASDKVVEAVGGGTDTVYSTVSWAMAAGQEIEYLRAYGAGATSGVALTGNELRNNLVGGSGNDTLNGGVAADNLYGGAGNDRYFVDNASDKVVEAVGGGTDTVYSTVSWAMAAGQEIEYLRAYGAGATSGVALTGNELRNNLVGGSGNDTLNGGRGNDTLAGGGGQDTFLFDTALAGNIDTVADFNASNETIQLDRSIFTAITTLGTLSASAFFTGAAAHDADDRITFNSATGNLSYDSDGTGAAAAVQFAHLNGNPALSNTNFTVVV